MKLMTYNGYYGSVEISTGDNCLFGKLQFIEPLVSYEAETVSALEACFHDAVEDYLKTCEDEGWQAEKSYKGTFNVRVGQELHKLAVVEAKSRDMNLNEFVKQAIEHELKPGG